MILGTWHDDDADDRVTFSALVRLDGAEVIDATAVASAQSAIFGLQLSREDALVHEPVAEFCDLLDHVLAENRDVGAAVYGSAV